MAPSMRHRDEFEQFARTGEVTEPTSTASSADDGLVNSAADAPNADRIEQHAPDVVTRTLLTDLSHREFPVFTADLLRRRCNSN